MNNHLDKKDRMKCLEMTSFTSLPDTSNTASSSESPAYFHSELVGTNILASMPNEILFQKASTPPYEEDDIDNPCKDLAALPMKASDEPPFPSPERTNHQGSGWKNIQDSVG